MNKFESLRDVIRHRRSVYPKQFNNRKVEHKVLQEILEAARWAPNHKITEPWRFHVIQEKGLQRLSTYLGEQYKLRSGDKGFNEFKYKKTIQKPLQSSVVIAICMKRSSHIEIPEWEELAAVSCAVQNMWLTASSLNVGAYWSSPKLFIEKNTFLDLEQHEQPLGLLYMGFTDIEIPDRSPGSIDLKTRWVNE